MGLSSENIWFYIDSDKKPQGPYSLAILDKAFGDKAFFVWKEGMEGWEVRSNISDLEEESLKATPAKEGVAKKAKEEVPKVIPAKEEKQKEKASFKDAYKSSSEASEETPKKISKNFDLNKVRSCSVESVPKTPPLFDGKLFLQEKETTDDSLFITKMALKKKIIIWICVTLSVLLLAFFPFLYSKGLQMYGDFSMSYSEKFDKTHETTLLAKKILGKDKTHARALRWVIENTSFEKEEKRVLRDYWKNLMESPRVTTKDKMSYIRYLYRKKEIYKAKALFREIEKTRENSVELLLLKSDVALYDKKYQEALRFLDEAKKIDPNCLEANFSQGHILVLFLNDVESKNKGKKILLDLLKKGKASKKNLLNAARDLLTLSIFSKEETLILKNYFKKNTSDIAILPAIQAASLFIREYPKERENIIFDVIDRYKGDLQNFHILIQWLNSVGSAQDSVNLLTASKMHLKQEQSYKLLVETLIFAKQWKLLREIINVPNPPVNNVFLFMYRAFLASKVGDSERAEALWEEVLRMSSSELDKVLEVATFARSVKAYQPAMRLYRLLLEKKPNLRRSVYHSMLPLVKGNSHNNLEDYYEFLREANLVLVDANVRLDMAYAQLILGKNLSEAKKNLKALHEMNPLNPYFISYYALALALTGEDEKAKELLQKIKSWDKAPIALGMVRTYVFRNQISEEKKSYALKKFSFKAGVKPEEINFYKERLKKKR